MSQRAVKIRRSKRTDFPVFMALLSPVIPAEAAKMQARHWRRLATDPTHDCYVAEQDGRIQGILLVCYIRRLSSHGWEAILDVVTSPSTRDDIGQALLDFAKVRARKRGCRRLLAYVVDHEERGQLALLAQAGFGRAGDVLSCGLP